MTRLFPLSEYLRSRWALWLAVTVFIIFKLPHLSYLFYWDESWSYQPAIRLMYEHGPSLMPNAIDTDFSRGHPLLFYCTVAAWMKLFGPSALAQHVFALCIFVALIIVVYELCLNLFNQRTALLSLAIILLQPILFVQSAMLLPEVMVALFSLLSIYCYATDKRWPTCAALLALMLTKESGMVAGLLLGISAFFRLFNKSVPLKDRIAHFLPVAGAWMGIVSFFVLQRVLNGWFLFPQHAGLISFEWSKIEGTTKCILGVIFATDTRQVVFNVLLFFSLVLYLNTRNIKYLLPVAISVLVYIYVGDLFYDVINRKLLTAILVACVAAMAPMLASLVLEDKIPTNRFIRLGIAFVIIYIAFCAVNFFTARYIIAALVFVLIFAAWYIERATAAFFNPVYGVVVILIILSGQYTINHSKGLGDVDMGAFDAMKVEQDIVVFLKQNYREAYILPANYHDYVHLKDPMTGYIKQEEFPHIEMKVSDSTQLTTYNNIEYNPTYPQVKNKYKLVYRTTHGDAWGEIYRLK